MTETERLSICIVGAGISGICAAIQLKRKWKDLPFTIFESNHEVGGTWLNNTYPGCACDVESHLYSYSFEPNPKWKSNYASQQEILAYLQNTAKKYNVYDYIQFNTNVQSLTWEDDIHKWRVAILSKANGQLAGQDLYFNIVINCPGILRQPNIPCEFLSFKNPMVHSSQWDATIQLENKIVGVVGSGASAIQIIPSIAPVVKELHVYQRSAPWVLPKRQFKFSEMIKWVFAHFPLIMWLFRCFLFLSNELNVTEFHKNSLLRFRRVKAAKKYFSSQIDENSEIYKKLRPEESFGCKRVSVSSDYYKIFLRDNIKLHCSNIIQVLEDKIVTKDGNQNQIDILILATGFRVQDYFSPMKIFGKQGVDISDLWKRGRPQTYFGTVFNKVPNHFMIFGPNTSPGHNSLIFTIECQVDLALQVISEILRRKAKSFEVTSRAQNEFMQLIDKNMENTIWGTSSCGSGSWYQNSMGYITALWPLSCITFWRKTRKIDYSLCEFH